MWDLFCSWQKMLLQRLSSDLIAKFKGFFSVHPLKLDRVGHHLFLKGGSPTTLFYFWASLLLKRCTLLFSWLLSSVMSKSSNMIQHTHVCVSVCLFHFHSTPDSWVLVLYKVSGTSLVGGQWLGCHTSTAGGKMKLGSHMVLCLGQKRKKLKTSVYWSSSNQAKYIQIEVISLPYHSILLPTLSQLMASINIQANKKKKITHAFFLSQPSPYHWLGFVSQTYPSPPSPCLGYSWGHGVIPSALEFTGLLDFGAHHLS